MAKQDRSAARQGGRRKPPLRATPTTDVLFGMPTIRSVVDMLQGRRDIAAAVVSALETGRGTAIEDPGIGELTPLQQARQIVSGLETAIEALKTTCPNPLDSSFVIRFNDAKVAGLRRP